MISSSKTETVTTPTIVKAEANVLRSPFFTLQNKNLSTLAGYEYSGRRTRNGETYQFVLEVTRNIATHYPGTLSRKAHTAFLSIATETGFPLDGPITWTWRDLCRRMRITCSGRTVSKLQEAIKATTGLLIQSQNALISHDGKRISTKKSTTTHLYNEVVFFNGEMPDGTIADTNYLWLSKWLLENLNHNYFAYVDYDLWRDLDDQSSIASRLYELCLTKFHKNAVLRINYPTLTELLPVKTQTCLYDAHRQLDRHFKIATDAGIIETPKWERRDKPIVAQLLINPGQQLLDFKNSQFSSLIAEETIENVTVKEIHAKPITPESKIVSDFYVKWQTAQQKGQSDTTVELRLPTAKELQQVKDYVAKYGIRKTRALIPIVISLLAEHWPAAKSFAAVDKYIDDAAQKYDAKQAAKKNATKSKQLAAEESKRAVKEQAATKAFYKKVQPLWDAASEEQKEAAREAFANGNAFLLKRERRSPGGTESSLRVFARQNSIQLD